MKLNIREIIEPANFSIIKGIVEPVNDLIKNGLDEFRAEDFEDDVGKSCYYLCDNSYGYAEIREVYLGETFTTEYSIDVIEDLDVYIFDLYYRDVVDEFVKDENDKINFYKYESYENLLDYLNTHNTKISEWEKSVIEICATGDENLLEEFTE